MNVTKQAARPIGRARDRLLAGTQLAGALALISALATVGVVQAAGEVTQIYTGSSAVSPFRYTANGVDYTWGVGENQTIEGFRYQNVDYRYVKASDRVELRRVDQPGVATGERCAMFAERFQTAFQLRPSFPGTSANDCDLSLMLSGPVINRGVLDIFSNTDQEANTIERVDFIFDNGLAAPVVEDLVASSGHVVAEKRGNNPIQIAAILSLDDSGTPDSYGPLVMVNPVGCADPDICYGTTNVSHNYAFFTNAAIPPREAPESVFESTESMGMAFVSLADLGLEAADIYYGVSYFGRDVDTDLHALNDPTTFPQDTADNEVSLGDGADIYGGVAGIFLAAPVSSITASIFVDENQNGVRDAGDPGVENVSFTLHQDTNANGVFDESGDDLLLSGIRSDADGDLQIPGVPDGIYFLTPDTASADIPPGLTIDPGSVPAVVEVVDTNSDPVIFVFNRTDNSENPGDGENPGDVNDAGPTAVADTVNALQGQSVTADLLENDVDTAGNGLTLVEFLSVSEGRATVVNNQLSYTPPVDFFGDTAFLYVVEDANGQRATGTVMVSVRRFSDINNNQINDFDECGCDDIGLITGIHGAGVGAVGLAFPMLLFVWFGRVLSRSRRQSRVDTEVLS